MNELFSSMTAVALALVGLATIAVLVSRNANTTGVIQSSAGGFSEALAVAESPVTGSSGFNFSFPGLTGAGLPQL